MEERLTKCPLVLRYSDSKIGETLAVSHAKKRAQQGFSADRIAKNFYQRFKQERKTFLKFIQGIQAQSDREQYASAVLNSLMFVYFIQKKGFLDEDDDYLHHRLRMMQEREGKDKFLSFYCDLLRRLFHKEPRQQARASELDALLGNVPYLNGNLFALYQLEQGDQRIKIPDEAFERIFGFFDTYQWHLDARPPHADNEIHPDVLGYIFEKHIHQKQMGAYYTQEDITGYISENTIIPALFDAAESKCAITFAPGGKIWRRLRENPDRYIYDAVKHGLTVDMREMPPRSLPEPLLLPEEVAVGLADVSQRVAWNKPAPDEYGLPTETWREVVARRKRYEEVRAKLAAGEIHSINDLITCNLNLRQFAQDVIAECEEPEWLRAFYRAMTGRPEQPNKQDEPGMSILDPACGSGAFLFAALNVLEPLYRACLERMSALMAELDRSSEKYRSEKFPDFRQVIEEVARHPNTPYYILKTIIRHNLFGVDLMDEAVEICKQRLFLKLVAQVERTSDLESLPEIDFNIRAGNTLVGYVGDGEVKQAMDTAFDFENFKEDKSQLDRCLAGEYGVVPNETAGFEKWRASHQPFHWFVEFHRILQRGGFDVMIGNPPYVEYSRVKNGYTVRHYKTESCANLSAFMWERCLSLAQPRGRIGMIVPVASVCTERYAPLQALLRNSGRAVMSHFNDRPSKLFDGLEHIRLSIILHEKGTARRRTFSTAYHKWQTVERPFLFQRLSFIETTALNLGGALAKIGSREESLILEKFSRQRKTMVEYTVKHGAAAIYYTRKLSHFVQILDFMPHIMDEAHGQREPSELKKLTFEGETERDVFLAILNSNLFYWLLTIYSDCRNLNRREIDLVRFDLERAEKKNIERLCDLSQRLMRDIEKNSKIMKMNYQGLGDLRIQCTYPGYSKAIINEIDRALAKHYGFTDEELDLIINYDIKYRMSRGNQQEARQLAICLP